MVANVAASNPLITTVSQGTFNVSSAGGVQGTAMPDPAVQFALAGGTLASTETLPMWGGVGIYLDTPGVTGGPNYTLGTVVGRATSLTNLLAFSVFDQNYAMINSPQSPVPASPSYGQVNYYPLGSRARIWLAADPSVATAAPGSLVNQSVSWDFVNQKIIPYAGATTISSGTYNSTSGLVTLTMASAVNLNPGDTVTVSSATGTGSFASINGTFQAGVGTTGSTVTYTIAPSLTLTITGGSLQTSGILPVQLLDFSATTSQTVVYNSVTGFLTWNFAGCAVLCRV